MAIRTYDKSLKVVLKLENGTQTIAKCKTDASDEGLYELGAAVAELVNETVEDVTTVKEVAFVEI